MSFISRLFVSPKEDQFKKACEKENLEIVKNLFNQVDQITNEKGLGIAAFWNRTAIIKFLLEEGINPNINDPNENSILFQLASYGNKEMIELYLKKDGNLHVVDQNEWNALHWCAKNGNLECCKCLVSVGIDYKAKDTFGNTPRNLAEQRNRFEIVEFLHEVEKDPSKYWNLLKITSKEFDQKFVNACNDGNLEMVKTFFTKVEQKTKEEGLRIVVVSSKKEIIKFLLEEGVNPNIKNSDGFPILFRIADLRNFDMMELYLAHGGNLNFVDEEKKRNALHWFAIQGDLETCKYLVSLGIDYKAKDKDGKTPRDLALTTQSLQSHEKYEVVKFFHAVERNPEPYWNTIKIKSTNIENELVEFLKSLNLSKFVEKFKSQGIELKNLEELKDEHFRELGMNINQRLLKFIEAIQSRMQKQNNEKKEIEFNKANSIIPNDFVREFGVKKSEIIEGNRLGGGSFGDVFQGIWNGLGVAIKKLKISTMSNSDADSFRDEANLMFKFRHPHIVALLGFVSEEPYMLIMEFVEKGNLADYLKSTNPNNNSNNNFPNLDWNKKKEITLQIAQGMLYLHDKGALHRDLKSLNVLLTKHLEVKISDFGLSTLKEGLNDSTKTSLVHAFGTVAWMAPELFNNERNSKESDVYSFGVVCFEISTHQFPWSGKSPIAICNELASGKREAIPTETPLEYSKLIELCWNQIPSSRPSFGTIVELIKKMNVSESGKLQQPNSEKQEITKP